MKNSKFIKLKAIFLLTVFALNTVIAFACSLGLNMGYNKKHHHDNNEEAASTHSHNHSHSISNHPHAGSALHQHDRAPKHSHDGAKHNHEQKNSDQDDCCNKTAVQFQQVDKSYSHAAKIQISTPVILLALLYAYNINPLSFSNVANKQYHFVPPDSPPIPDIRVAIQSFQI